MTQLWPKASVHVVGLRSANACRLRDFLLSRVCGVYAFTVANIKRSGNKGTSDLATTCHGFIHPYVVRKHTQPYHALSWCVGGEASGEPHRRVHHRRQKRACSLHSRRVSGAGSLSAAALLETAFVTLFNSHRSEMSRAL